MRAFRSLRRERYPNLARALIERGPYYRGPRPTKPPLRLEFAAWIAAVAVVGAVAGWAL